MRAARARDTPSIKVASSNLRRRSSVFSSRRMPRMRAFLVLMLRTVHHKVNFVIKKCLRGSLSSLTMLTR